jgi:hypothetical protein
MRLLNTHELEFVSDDEGDGYLDPETREWIRDETPNVFKVKGSLQPFTGKTRELQVQGLKSVDVRVFYTKSKLKTVEEYGEASADTTKINGIPYIVNNVEDWTGVSRRIDHYRAILIKMDKG